MADPVTAKELREELGPLAHQITALNDKVQAEQRDFDGEERGQWDKLNKEYNLLKARAENAARAEKILLELASPVDEIPAQVVANRQQAPGRQDYNGDPKAAANREESREASEEDRCLALQAWLRVQCDKDLKPHHVKACERTGIRPHARELSMNLHKGRYANYRQQFRQFSNNLSANTGSTGNFTIPEGFVNNLERALLQFGGMRQVADVMRTDGGNDMPWPTINATTNKGRIIGENVTDSTTLEPTFGRVIFRAYKYTSDFIKVPVELLEDSAFELAATLGDLQGEAIGRIQNDHFTTGTSSGQPMGLITACSANSATFTPASASALSFDDIFGLIHSVDPAYRGQGCGFMLHDSILLIIRKLKDGQGRYLWEPSTVVGEPDRLAGYPVQVNQSMDNSVASGKFTVAFGLFSKYKIRDAGEVRMRRLTERFADSDQEAFIGFLRSDGNLLDAGSHPVKVIAH